MSNQRPLFVLRLIAIRTREATINRRYNSVLSGKLCDLLKFIHGLNSMIDESDKRRSAGHKAGYNPREIGERLDHILRK